MFQIVMLWFLISFCLLKEQKGRKKETHIIKPQLFGDVLPKHQTFKCTLRIGALIKQGTSEAITNNDTLHS